MMNCFFQSKLIRFRAITLLFVAFFILKNDAISQFSSDKSHELFYKFSVNDVTNPIEAEAVLEVLSEQSFTSSVNFIDDCDCFKLSSGADLSYEILKTTLKANNLILGNEIFVSDGAILTNTIILNDK